MILTRIHSVLISVEKLVNPAHSFNGEGFLKRTNSNTSLNSLVGNEGESIMRVCKTCRKLLERRDIMTELRNTKPPIVKIYDVSLLFFFTTLVVVFYEHFIFQSVMGKIVSNIEWISLIFINDILICKQICFFNTARLVDHFFSNFQNGGYVG